MSLRKKLSMLLVLAGLLDIRAASAAAPASTGGAFDADAAHAAYLTVSSAAVLDLSHVTVDGQGSGILLVRRRGALAPVAVVADLAMAGFGQHVLIALGDDVRPRLRPGVYEFAVAGSGRRRITGIRIGGAAPRLVANRPPTGRSDVQVQSAASNSVLRWTWELPVTEPQRTWLVVGMGFAGPGPVAAATICFQHGQDACMAPLSSRARMLAQVDDFSGYSAGPAVLQHDRYVFAGQGATEGAGNSVSAVALKISLY